MNKAVIISIQPKWCELIASGKKTVEVRKTKPKLETPFKCYIYQTKMKWAYTLLRTLRLHKLADARVMWLGKVIGEFVCNKISEIGYSPERHGTYVSDIENLHVKSCVNFEEMFDYIADGYGYGWHISDLVIYDKPKELGEFHKPTLPTGLCYEDDAITKPPQSWCYVEEV